VTRVLIEINFPLSDEARAALVESDKQVIIAKKRNLTGGEAVLQILIGVMTSAATELLKHFLQKRMESNAKATVVINNVKIVHVEQISAALLREPQDAAGNTNEGQKTPRISKTRRRKPKRKTI
jgi:hypothetical protein